MLRKIKKFIFRQYFNPGPLGLLINPFYFARRGLYKNVKALAKHVRGKTLDVGCGKKPYEALFNASEYIGMDIEQSGHGHADESIDVYYDGRAFPFRKEEFDSVVTFQAFEHVFNPEGFLSEVRRVLKDNGVLLMTAPFVWDEHEQPYDYARYSSFGLKHLLERNGFKVVEQRKSVNSVAVAFQMLNAYIYKKTNTPFQVLNVLLTVVLMAPFNILGLVLSLVLPKNNDLYLDNIVLARKKPKKAAK